MNVKLALGITAGVLAGGAIGYAIASSRLGRKALEDVEDVVDDLRIPDPSYAMQIAETDDEFATLDDLICECGAPLILAIDPNADDEAVVAEIRDCVAKKLYPQFPWPPVSGDHPTVSQLYSELSLLARRAFATASICPTRSTT